MRTAFTLVELIVVIAIIAMLMALGLPVFRLARERAAETVCQSNLRQMAVILKTYCSDHDSQFPDPLTLYHSWQSWPDANFPKSCRWHDPEIGPASTLLRECRSYQGSLIPYIGNPRVLLCKTGSRANRERGCNNDHRSRANGPEVPVVPQYTYTMNGLLGSPLQAGGWPSDLGASHLNARSIRMLEVRRESQVTRSPSEVFAFGEENSWFVNPGGHQYMGKLGAWPAPYNLSSLRSGPPEPPDSTYLSSLRIQSSYCINLIDVAVSLSTMDMKEYSYVNMVRADELLPGDAFATYHRPRGGDLNTGYSFVSMLDGHVRKVTVSDQLRKSRQVENVPPSRLGPGGNLHLAWPIDIPPLGGWENQ